ncbi:RNA-binding family protein [Rhynchospora pubera]|uniref:RNA-binding family protein n=1 Tax=Rhynchospora pubera TaxID=906938 RepID=A0AAV8GFF5_9POAL|nr:RNA-binding family protein [Rhynchospora pubera]
MATSATIGSYISTVNTHLNSKSIPSLLRISTSRVPRVHSMPHLYHTCITPKPRMFSRILAAVSQEEVTATAVEEEVMGEEEEAVKEEEVEVESEVGGEGEGEGEGEETVMKVNTKLYFGNLPYNCDSSQLASVVQEYATPEMVEVLYDRQTGRSRGFAFVTMSSVEDCEHVIKNLDGTQFNGRTMRVNFSDKPKEMVPLYKETKHKLFVGNLSWSATSEDLEKLFQKCGNVVSARILYDGDTGRSRGYGFVSYLSQEEMEEALQTLEGEELDGRPIRVSLAQGGRRNP